MSKYISRNYQLIKLPHEMHDILYTKLKEKKPDQDWFAGVTTTKIACRVGCKAGPPHKENVIFSKNLLDLLCHGMRECKVCKPFSYAADEKITPFLDKIQKASPPSKDWEKGQVQASAWVEQHHQTNLNRYIRVKRINHLLASAKGNYHETILFHRYWTPIGMMIGCFSNQGLCLLEFYDRLMLEAELIKLQKKLKANFKFTSTHLTAIKIDAELSEYFSGKRDQFTIPLHRIGSSFQQRVWKTLEKIPAGEIWSYQQQATVLGDAKAVRAVANANGSNSISILIPCHRVIGKNGKLTGYGGGLPRKQFLLDLEKVYKKKLTKTPLDSKEIFTETQTKKRKLSIMKFFESPFPNAKNEKTIQNDNVTLKK